ncbi:MAG: MBOAT family protein [Lachnospiraceae bacterium]|nr:MBOAT family protein [Lachnospiraceae bacterium]
MVFSSTLFLFRFLPIFVILYFVAPGRMKNFILFLGSLIFYAWGEPVYVGLMLFSTLSDYLHGLAIGACKKQGTKKFFLVTSVLINLGVLGFFKYADFLIQSVNTLAGTNIPLLNLPLPIGISFYTFQTMSYSIDCYRGQVKVQKNLLDFAVFVTMFPQLIAGPIVKYVDVEKELRERKPDILQISYGCKRFVIGLAKKVLLANNLGLLWTEISVRDFGSLSVMTAWMGILAFALQIYFDFSGYSDMAIGLGACFGFHFPENFNYPYISASVTEFWRRWHMTLSSWFREYVYIPLGGNRKGLLRQLFNILVVWSLTGIWHGAGWNFLFWGLWFAFWLMLEKLGLKKLFDFLPKGIGRTYTLFLVLISWVFFSIENTTGIKQYLLAMFGANGGGLYNREALFLGLENVVLFVIALVAATPLFSRLAARLGKTATGYGIALYRILEKLVPAVLLIASIAYIVDATYNPFLYFRF